MRPSGNIPTLIALTLLLGAIYACAKPEVKPQEIAFFVVPPVTYLLDTPGDGGHSLGPL